MEKKSLITCALAAAVSCAALSAQTTVRYQQSGNWTDLNVNTGAQGWQTLTALPDQDTIGRVNWGNNTITVNTDLSANPIGQLQIGVDEPGNVIIESGGVLNTTSAGLTNGRIVVGNNRSAGGTDLTDIGTLTVNAGGTANVDDILFVGLNAEGILNVSGTVTSVSHLWVGFSDAGGVGGVVGTVNIFDGGLLDVGGAFGLDFNNAGATGNVNVNGGEFRLNAFTPGNLNNGVVTIGGSGIMTIPGNDTADVNQAILDGTLVGDGGATLSIVYDGIGDLTTVSVVPEPSAAALLIGLAAVSFVGLRRRRA